MGAGRMLPPNSKAMNAHQALTNAQAAALLGNRHHNVSLLRRPEWLNLCPRRRPALIREVQSINERLHAAVPR